MRGTGRNTLGGRPVVSMRSLELYVCLSRIGSYILQAHGDGAIPEVALWTTELPLKFYRE